MRITRSTSATPQKGNMKKLSHVSISNGDAGENSPSSYSSSGSRLEPPPDSEPEELASDNQSVAEEEADAEVEEEAEEEEEETGEEEAEEEEEEEEVEVKVVKKSAKKKRKIAEAVEEEEDATCRFPMNRIRMIAKNDGGDDLRLSHEAIFLINKASEKFLELFCEEAYSEAAGKRKNLVAYDHLASSVAKEQRFCFLSDLIPEKITAEEALKERQLANSDPKISTTHN